MWLFEQARDYYTSSPLAQKLSWEAGAALILLVIAFIGFHLFRRAFGTPNYEETDRSDPPGAATTFIRYTAGGRLYHWGIVVVITFLLLSGAAFFFPGSLFSLEAATGFSWLLLHVVLAGIFIVFVLAHIAYAIFDTGLYNMRFHRGDGRDFTQRARFYLGGSERLPKHGKFDVFQKTYHLFLILFALVMIVTGISLFLSSELLATLEGNWLRWQRLLHDVFSFLFLAVIAGHVYLRLLGKRRAKLTSMVTGQLSRAAFEREHDWRLWQPDLPRDPAAAAPPPTAVARDSK